MIDLIGLRHIPHGPKPARLGLDFPLLAVTVALEHYVLGLSYELAHDSHNGRRAVLTCRFENIHFVAEVL